MVECPLKDPRDGCLIEFTRTGKVRLDACRDDSCAILRAQGPHASRWKPAGAELRELLCAAFDKCCCKAQTPAIRDGAADQCSLCRRHRCRVIRHGYGWIRLALKFHDLDTQRFHSTSEKSNSSVSSKSMSHPSSKSFWSPYRSRQASLIAA